MKKCLKLFSAMIDEDEAVCCLVAARRILEFSKCLGRKGGGRGGGGGGGSVWFLSEITELNSTTSRFLGEIFFCKSNESLPR